MESILESNTNLVFDDKILISIISKIEKNNILINERHTQNKIYISPIKINSAINKCTLQTYKEVYSSYFQEYDKKNSFNMTCIIFNIFRSASVQPGFYECFTELLSLMYKKYNEREKFQFILIISKFFVHLFLTYKKQEKTGSSYDKFCFEMKEKKRIIGSYIILSSLSKKISKLNKILDIQFEHILKDCRKFIILTEVLINIIPVAPKRLLKENKNKIKQCHKIISQKNNNKRNSLLLLNVIEKYL